jgi:hypothetical protein
MTEAELEKLEKELENIINYGAFSVLVKDAKLSLELLREVKRLRVVLSYYADRSNWVSRTGRIGTSSIDLLDRDTAPNGDFPYSGGALARKALG